MIERILSYFFRSRVIKPDCPEGKQAKPLMTRWFIFRCKPFAIFIHQFHRSDIDEFHDHPWAFWTFLLSYGYWENVPQDGKFTTLRYRNWKPRFSLLYRPALFRHFIEIPRPMWTLVIRKRRERDWGFIMNGEWVQWERAEGLMSRSICED